MSADRGPQPGSWASATSQDPRSVALRAARARMAGQAAAARMTPEARRERARKAGLAAAANQRARMAAGLPARKEKPKEFKAPPVPVDLEAKAEAARKAYEALKK